MSSRQILNPIEQSEILKKIGMLLLDFAPSSWVEIRCQYSALVGISTIHTESTLEDGSIHRINPPDSVWDEMDKLRPGMYVEGKGTWYSVEYVIKHPGKYYVEYNYDNPPEFDVPPTGATFVLDLKYFPRDDENIPGWLRDKLHSAEESER